MNAQTGVQGVSLPTGESDGRAAIDNCGGAERKLALPAGPRHGLSSQEISAPDRSDGEVDRSSVAGFDSLQGRHSTSSTAPKGVGPEPAERSAGTTPAPNPSPQKRIEVTNRRPGYAHTQFWGTCSPDVTVADIEVKFYHEYFGGRSAWVRDGQWGAIRHDD